MLLTTLDWSSLLGIVVSLVILMYLAYRGHSVIVLSPILAMFAVVASGGTHVLMGTYTQVFMKGLGDFVVNFAPIFLLGALFGKLMDDSGSARSIAEWLVSKLGTKHAVLSIVLACAVLTYGGVTLFVVGFAVYPIATSLFRKLQIPKRFIPGAIALGAFTFTMTALPGSPAIQNAIPMRFFQTDSFAAPGLSIIASLIMFILGMMWLNYRQNKAMSAGERYGDHKEDIHIDAHPNDPNIGIAILPIILVIAINFFCVKYFIPSMDTSYLADPKYGNTSLNSVLGTWSIIIALVIACVAIILFNRKSLTNIRESVSKGALSSLLPIFNTASEVGYGSVIASLAGFAIVKHLMLDISPGNPIISEAVFINVMAGITGSASGGLSIALQTMGDTYMQLAQQFGINPELLHRVASISSGGLDALPHNGAVISLLTICALTHKESYKDIFMVAVAIPIVALAIMIALSTIFGSF